MARNAFGCFTRTPAIGSTVYGITRRGFDVPEERKSVRGGEFGIGRERRVRNNRFSRTLRVYAATVYVTNGRRSVGRLAENQHRSVRRSNRKSRNNSTRHAET